MKKEILKYFDAVPAPRKLKVLKLHALIVARFPDANIDMHYSMPTYRHGNDWVAIANQKNYVSLYTCSSEHIAKFRADHPDIKTGKGCINFRDRDAIPEAAVRQVIEHAMLKSKP